MVIKNHHFQIKYYDWFGKKTEAPAANLAGNWLMNNILLYLKRKFHE